MTLKKKPNPVVADYEVRFRDSRGRFTGQVSKARYIQIRLLTGRKIHTFDIPKTKKFRTVKMRWAFVSSLVSELRIRRDRLKAQKLLRRTKTHKKPAFKPDPPSLPRSKIEKIRPKAKREEYLEDEVEEKLDVPFGKPRFGFSEVYSRSKNATLSLEFMHYDLKKKIDVTPQNMPLVEKFLRDRIKTKWHEVIKENPDYLNMPFMIVVEHEGVVKRYNRKTRKAEAVAQFGYSRKRDELADPDQFEEFLEDYFKFGGTSTRKAGWKECMNDYLKRQVSSHFFVKGFYFEFLIDQKDGKGRVKK